MLYRINAGLPRYSGTVGTKLVVKRNRFLAETPKPKQGSREKPKFRPKPKFRLKHFFRPKQPLLAEMFCFGQNNIWFYTRFLAKIGA